jgi:hypothetical protein
VTTADNFFDKYSDYPIVDPNKKAMTWEEKEKMKLFYEQ